jgi:hypothetical protein
MPRSFFSSLRTTWQRDPLIIIAPVIIILGTFAPASGISLHHYKAQLEREDAASRSLRCQWVTEANWARDQGPPGTAQRRCEEAPLNIGDPCVYKDTPLFCKDVPEGVRLHSPRGEFLLTLTESQAEDVQRIGFLMD